MPSRWQREFMCDWCGERATRLAGELRTPGLLGWGTQWRLCDECIDALFALRGSMTWEHMQAFKSRQLLPGLQDGQLVQAVMGALTASPTRS